MAGETPGSGAPELRWSRCPGHGRDLFCADLGMKKGLASVSSASFQPAPRERRRSDICSSGEARHRLPYSNWDKTCFFLHQVMVILTDELVTATWRVILGGPAPQASSKIAGGEEPWGGGKFLRAPSVQGGTRAVGMVLPFHRWRDFHLKLAASKSFPVSPIREEAVSDSPGPGHFFHSRDVSISLRSRFLSQTVISQLLPCSRQRRH